MTGKGECRTDSCWFFWIWSISVVRESPRLRGGPRFQYLRLSYSRRTKRPAAVEEGQDRICTSVRSRLSEPLPVAFLYAPPVEKELFTVSATQLLLIALCVGSFIFVGLFVIRWRSFLVSPLFAVPPGEGAKGVSAIWLAPKGSSEFKSVARYGAETKFLVRNSRLQGLCGLSEDADCLLRLLKAALFESLCGKGFKFWL